MLIFDFDGVLMDSIDEVVVTAYNAINSACLTPFKALPNSLKVLFKRNRYHFQPAGDAIILMQWCLKNHIKNNQKILSDAHYQSLLAQERVPLKERTRLFFEARQRFVSADKKGWLALNTPFQPIWNTLIELDSQRVIILTNKNASATLALGRYFGLPVAKSNVYAADGGKTKAHNLELIMQRIGKNDRPISFLDDSIKNLIQLETHFNSNQRRMQPLLASWGYLGPQDIKTAVNRGYPVCRQAELVKTLDKALPKGPKSILER